MAELAPGLSYAEFVAEALRHRSEEGFRSSPFFVRYGADLVRLLTTPQWDRSAPDCISEQGRPLEEAPEEKSGKAEKTEKTEKTEKAAEKPLRLVHWNIEKGKELPGLIRHLTSHPVLRDADVWCLNEVDSGTARGGGNADVARELAQALHCRAVYLPSFIECTKGVDDDLQAKGENELGLHGLAILSRLPITDARMAVLPSCFDYFRFHEKRFGFRQGLYVRLLWGGRSLIVGTTHLEVRRTPHCRAGQFLAFLSGLDEARREWGEDAPVIVTGDWNTNSFPRGGLVHSARGFLRIVRTLPERLDGELLRPFDREPLFQHLTNAGFELEAFNDQLPTASQMLDSIEDLSVLPASWARGVLNRFGLTRRMLHLRLDWIAARGLRPASPSGTLAGLEHAGRPVSDHAVIFAVFSR